MTNSTHLRSLSCRTTLTEIERRPRVALCVGPRWRPSPMFTPLRSRLPRPTPGCGGGRPATVSPRRISGMCGPLFRRSLELAPCPTQSGAAGGASHRSASARRGPLRSPPRLRPQPSRDRHPSAARRCSRRPVARHTAPRFALRGPSSCVSASAPGPCCRSALRALLLGARRALRPAPRGPGPCAGPGSCPGPCRHRRLRRRKYSTIEL